MFWTVTQQKIPKTEKKVDGPAGSKREGKKNVAKNMVVTRKV